MKHFISVVVDTDAEMNAVFSAVPPGALYFADRIADEEIESQERWKLLGTTLRFAFLTAFKKKSAPEDGARPLRKLD